MINRAFDQRPIDHAFTPFVGRGSPDPARVTDRMSPSFGVCSESANAFEAGAYDERGRPSVRHSGGVVDPRRTLDAFINGNRMNPKPMQSPTFITPGSDCAGCAGSTTIERKLRNEATGSDCAGCAGSTTIERKLRNEATGSGWAGCAGSMTIERKLRNEATGSDCGTGQK